MTTDIVKIDKAWKFSQGIGISSSGKEFYEEDATDSGFTLHGNDIYVNDIPTVPPGVSSAIVEVVADFVLINDISVPGNLSWYASTDGSTLEQMRATRQSDWIPPRFGQGYTVVLTDNLGQQIFTTDSIEWVFDYKTGILICENDPDVSYSLPLKLTGYRYIGERLTGLSGNAAWIDIEDAGDYYTGDNVEDALQELGLGLGNTNTAISDHLVDATGAHAASAISVVDSGDNYTGTEVESVLAEIATSIGAISSEAVNITIVDAGEYFTGTEVETALQEVGLGVDTNTTDIGTVSTDLNDHIIAAIGAHAATAISVDDIGEKFVATEVEGVLSELWGSTDFNTGSILAHTYTSDEAHSAAVISIEDVGGYYTATNVEAVLAESAVNFNNHLADTVDSHDASAISVLDTGGYYTGIEVEAVLAESAVNFNNHLADTVDSHDASAISVLDTGGYYTGTEVEAVLQELGLGLSTTNSALSDHLADTVDSHDASAISVLDTGGYYTGTEVEAVLAESAVNFNDHLADTVDSHDASAISVLDTAENFTATNVEDVLVELIAEINTNKGGILINAADISDHLAATVDSHDASSISVLDTVGYFNGDNVELVLEELAIRVDASAADILTNSIDISDSAADIVVNFNNMSDHLADTDGAHAASAVSLLDSGDYIDATDSEYGMEELAIDKDDNKAKILEHDVLIYDLQNENSNTNEYTPTGSADIAGNTGDMTYDNSFVYVKTGIGWQRAALSTF